MRSKILIVALIALLMAGGLVIIGCAELADAYVQSYSSYAEQTCASKNGCNSYDTYCGRSSCAASQRGSTGCKCQ